MATYSVRMSTLKAPIYISASTASDAKAKANLENRGRAITARKVTGSTIKLQAPTFKRRGRRR